MAPKKRRFVALLFDGNETVGVLFDDDDQVSDWGLDQETATVTYVGMARLVSAAAYRREREARL